MAKYRRSQREEEVLRLVAVGKSNQQIADALGITFATAKWHVSELLTKECVDSREELADLWRAENGLARRVRRVFGPLGLSLPAKVFGGTAVAGVIALGAVGIIFARDAQGSAAEDSGTPSSATGATTSDATSGPRVPYLSADEARATAERLAAGLMARGNHAFVDAKGNAVDISQMSLTRLQRLHTTGLIEFTDGGRSNVAEGDVWVVEWLATDIESTSSAISDGVLSVDIALRDDADAKLVAGGVSLTSAAGYLPIGDFIAATWPQDGTSLSLASLSSLPAEAGAGICAVVTPRAASFRIILGERDVTAAANNFGAPFGFENAEQHCVRPGSELEPGSYSVVFEAFDAAGAHAQIVERQITLVP